MVRVFSHDNIMMVYNIKNLLEHAGIDCEIRNELSIAASGEVPPIEVWPELRVAETDQQKAMKLVDEAVNGNPADTSWFCPKCSETNAPAFELCWQCGTDRSS